MATYPKCYLSDYKLTPVPRLAGSINMAPRPNKLGIRRLLRKRECWQLCNFEMFETVSGTPSASMNSSIQQVIILKSRTYIHRESQQRHPTVSGFLASLTRDFGSLSSSKVLLCFCMVAFFMQTNTNADPKNMKN